MKSLIKLNAFAAHGAEIIVAMLLGSMFAVFLLQILFRYVLSWPVGWTVEWVAIAWLWGILFGYAFVVRDTDVIRLDLVYAVVPRGVQRVVDVVAGLTCVAIIAWTLPKCWVYEGRTGRIAALAV